MTKKEEEFTCTCPSRATAAGCPYHGFSPAQTRAEIRKERKAQEQQNAEARARAPRSAKFVAAEQSLPEELRPTFARLVDEYQYHAHVLGGFPWVAYKIIAEIVRAGWRPTKENADA